MAHAPTELPIALVVDEAGQLSWHLPESHPQGAVRSVGTSMFTLRGTVPDVEPVGPARSRGIVGALGKKLVEIVVVPLVAKAAGRVLADGIRAWETDRRPHRLRTYETTSPEDGTDPGIPVRDGFGGWGGRRGLLLVHGTFNVTASSFNSMGDEFLRQLHDRYDGRVLAFDHPTVGVSPDENVAWLVGELGGLTPHVDVLASSRGGLVARRLAAGGAVDVRQVVFAATPNAGTPLADSRHVGKLIDAVTNTMSMIPDNPITDTAEVVITILRHLAAGTVDRLGGLAAMHPSGEWLADLNAQPPGAGFRMLASDYEPTAGVANWAKGLLLDRVFGSTANDLVVPTESVLGPWGAADVPPAHRLVFGPEAGVTHGGFLRRDDVQSQVLAWLQ